MENWNKIKRTMNKLIDQGLFPGIAYDSHGWEAWVFYSNPIEGIGDPMKHTKVFGDTATEVIEKLAAQVLK